MIPTTMMISRKSVRTCLLTASVLAGTSLLAACGSDPVTVTTERTTTTTTAPADSLAVPPGTSTTTTTTHSTSP